MYSTALKRIAAGAVFFFTSYSALAELPSPRILVEPVLGLRYEAARVKFEPLPARVIANCEYMVDSEDWRNVWFIYAQAQDVSGRMYYATSGYAISKNLPGKPSFTTGGAGLIFLRTAEHVPLSNKYATLSMPGCLTTRSQSPFSSCSQRTTRKDWSAPLGARRKSKLKYGISTSTRRSFR